MLHLSIFTIFINNLQSSIIHSFWLWRVTIPGRSPGPVSHEKNLCYSSVKSTFPVCPAFALCKVTAPGIRPGPVNHEKNLCSRSVKSSFLAGVLCRVTAPGNRPGPVSQEKNLCSRS